MPGPFELIRWELEVFLAALALVVALQLVTGRIRTRGLLHGRITGRSWGRDAYLSPERIQLLLFTLGAAAHYLSLAVDGARAGTLPPVPDAWLPILGGSNALYLVGKAYTQLPLFRVSADSSSRNG